MRYGSVCSGIEAATVAWHPLGWTPSFFSEIEPFPRAVLKHHYPSVPLHGDFTTIKADDYEPIDLLVGGTPCQSFSVAGLRKGLDDERGNLALEFCRLARRLGPKWVCWENVPGVLSLDGGRAFASILGGLADCGYGLAYRVLDAQYVRVDGFGRAVPQRRRRVFVVGCAGGQWQRAAAVLFERESLSWNPPPRREAGQRPAPTIAARTRGGGGLGTDFDCDGGLIPSAFGLIGNGEYADRLATLRADGGDAGGGSEHLVAMSLNAHPNRSDAETETLLAVAHSLRGGGFDASEDGTGRGIPLVPEHPITLAIRGRGDTHQLEYRQDGTANAVLTPNGGRAGMGVGAICFDETQITSADNRSQPQAGDPSHPLAAGARPPTIAFNARQDPDSGPVTHPLDTDGSTVGVLSNWRVRRLTPTECEKLQGFPVGYTDVPYRKRNWTADGPRYRAIGNSMACNVMRWIGTRIQMVEDLSKVAVDAKGA